MEVFSSSSASSSKTYRGCLGFGTIASTEISAKRAPGTGLSWGSSGGGGAAANGVGVTMPGSTGSADVSITGRTGSTSTGMVAVAVLSCTGPVGISAPSPLPRPPRGRFFIRRLPATRPHYAFRLTGSLAPRSAISWAASK